MERGNIGIAVFLVFISITVFAMFPLMAVANRTDDMTQSTVETILNDFVYTTINKGKLTMDDYTKLQMNLDSLNSHFDINMEIKQADTNPKKKTIQASHSKEGENVSISLFTAQILERLNTSGIVLNSGDKLIVKASTPYSNSKLFVKAFYKFTGNEPLNIISAEASGIK